MSEAGSQNSQDLLKAHEALLKQQSHNDLLVVMSTPEGRRFAWDLIVRSGTFEASFAGDAALTAFKEGQRSFGIDLFERLKDEATDFYITALNEQHADWKRRAQLREAAKAEALKQEEEENT